MGQDVKSFAIESAVYTVHVAATANACATPVSSGTNVTAHVCVQKESYAVGMAAAKKRYG